MSREITYPYVDPTFQGGLGMLHAFHFFGETKKIKIKIIITIISGILQRAKCCVAKNVFIIYYVEMHSSVTL